LKLLFISKIFLDYAKKNLHKSDGQSEDFHIYGNAEGNYGCPERNLLI